MSLSRLRPDTATMTGLLTAAGVFLIYNNALPTVTDLRMAAPHDADAENARRKAAIESTVLIGAVFLVARDINSYIISGAALVGLDLMYKHANAVHPATGKMDTGSAGVSIAETYPLADYSEAS